MRRIRRSDLSIGAVCALGVAAALSAAPSASDGPSARATTGLSLTRGGEGIAVSPHAEGSATASGSASLTAPPPLSVPPDTGPTGPSRSTHLSSGPDSPSHRTDHGGQRSSAPAATSGRPSASPTDPKTGGHPSRGPASPGPSTPAPGTTAPPSPTGPSAPGPDRCGHARPWQGLRIAFTSPCEGATVPQLVPVRLKVPEYPAEDQGAFVITGTVLTDATGRRLPEPFTFAEFHPLALDPGTSEETGRPGIWQNNVIVGTRCAPQTDRTRVELRLYLLSPAGLTFAEREWRQSTPVRVPRDSVLMDRITVTRHDACR